MTATRDTGFAWKPRILALCGLAGVVAVAFGTLDLAPFGAEAPLESANAYAMGAATRAPWSLPGAAGGADGASGASQVAPPPDAALYRQLGRLAYDNEREIRRLLEVRGIAGPDPDVTQVQLLVDTVTYAFEQGNSRAARRSAVAVLARVPPRLLTADPWAQRLVDDDPVVRRLAVRGCARSGRERWEEILWRADDADAGVRVVAAAALTGVREEKAVDALLRLLYDEDADVIRAAGSALGKTLRDPLPARFLGAFDAPRANVRLAATEAIGVARGPDAADLLVRMCGDTDWRIRRSAMQSLGRLRGAAVAPAAAALVATLGDRDLPRTDRFEAAQALVPLSHPAVVPAALQAAERDPDPVIRLFAARLALAHDDASAVPTLTELMNVSMGPHCDEEDREFVRSRSVIVLSDALGLSTTLGPEEFAAAARQAAAALAGRRLGYHPAYIREFW